MDGTDVRHADDCDGHQVLHMIDPIREAGVAGRTLWRPSCICGWQAAYTVTNHGGACLHTRREHSWKQDQWGACTGQCCDQEEPS
jgi:hypothetical protein